MMKKVILSLSVVLGILILWFAVDVAFSVKEKFEVLDKQLEKVENEKTDTLTSIFKKNEELLKKAMSVRDSTIIMNQLIDSVRKELIEKYVDEIDNPKSDRIYIFFYNPKNGVHRFLCNKLANHKEFINSFNEKSNLEYKNKDFLNDTLGSKMKNSPLVAYMAEMSILKSELNRFENFTYQKLKKKF